MTTDNVVRITRYDPMAEAGQRISAAWKRTRSTDREHWVDGSILLAVEISHAYTQFGNVQALGHWLTSHRYLNISRNEVGALANLGRRDDLRQIMEKTAHRRYERLWQEVRPASAARKKPIAKTESKVSFKEAARSIKLGENYERLMHTSLGTPAELDAMVKLVDAFPEDFHKIMTRALAGETVSAQAVLEDRGRHPPPTIDVLRTAFKANHQFISKWLRATHQTRTAFLMELIKEEATHE
jgi:hypothetical protein